MKAKTIALDVDFIGGGPPPTAKELKMISEAIKADREKRGSLNSPLAKHYSPSPPHP